MHMRHAYMCTHLVCMLHYTTLHSLHYIALHHATLHCITLQCTALHCIDLHCSVLHYITLHYITFYSIALHCITKPLTLHLHWTALHCIALHCITLRYITLHRIAVHCIALPWKVCCLICHWRGNTLKLCFEVNITYEKHCKIIHTFMFNFMTKGNHIKYEHSLYQYLARHTKVKQQKAQCSFLPIFHHMIWWASQRVHITFSIIVVEKPE